MTKQFLNLPVIFTIGATALLSAACLAETVGFKARYLPYSDSSGVRLRAMMEARADVEVWWSDPEQIRGRRKGSDLPLSGVHIAIDPGHIGGEWAEIEGRHFKIHPNDYAVREGELVLLVARDIQARLLRLGAEVTLLRDSFRPLNPKSPDDYLEQAMNRVSAPKDVSLASLFDYALALRAQMNRLSAVSGELIERARLVNEVIRPDALLSLHINAAPWPLDDAGALKYELVDSNHAHVLIFGCLSDAELSVPMQADQLLVKMHNGSGAIELDLGQALGEALGQATSLPPSLYDGKNAVRLDGFTPYLWARNLMLLRYVECPVVLLEPYIANSKQAYSRLQEAIRIRKEGGPLPEGDILLEYADAVVRGLLDVYGPIEE